VKPPTGGRYAYLHPKKSNTSPDHECRGLFVRHRGFAYAGSSELGAGERLLTALLLLSLAWLVFGIVVVSRRLLTAIPN
jgi:hypothetical protein